VACYHADVRIGALALFALGGCQLVIGLEDPTRGHDASPHDGRPPHDGAVSIDAAEPPVDAPMGMCFDGGSARPIVSPVSGELVINEFMPDPALVSDGNGEWVELRTTAAVDLNGVRLTDGATTLEIDDASCLRFAAGELVLIAADGNPAVNGGLPTVDAILTFALPSDGMMQLRDPMDQLFQTVTWAGAPSGTSMIVSDPNVCGAPAGTASYNGTDVGTPRAANSPATC
jgi:hypothetical protein